MTSAVEMETIQANHFTIGFSIFKEVAMDRKVSQIMPFGIFSHRTEPGVDISCCLIPTAQCLLS